MIKYKYIYLIGLLSLLLSLSSSCNKSNGKRMKKSPFVSREIYERDRKQIVDCYMNNIDYYRSNYYDDKYSDIANYYTPYVEFYYGDRDYYVPAPIPVTDYIKITVDTILYDHSGIKCFIFAVIEKKTIILNGLKSREEGRNFDAMALIGVRSQITDSLCLYPFVKFKTFGFESYQSAINELKRLYFNYLKGDCIAGSVYKSRRFDFNVGEEGFFESVIFQRYTDSTFYYQYIGYDLMQYHFMK